MCVSEKSCTIDLVHVCNVDSSVQGVMINVLNTNLFKNYVSHLILLNTYSNINRAQKLICAINKLIMLNYVTFRPLCFWYC